MAAPRRLAHDLTVALWRVLVRWVEDDPRRRE
jgi:hypothetical protein